MRSRSRTSRAGRSQEALDALRAFLKADDLKAETDEARRDLAELPMAATFQVAQVLQGQGKFDEAIAAFQGYLAQFPNGPQSADAQRAILDTQLAQIADDHERNARHKEARAAWQAFVAAEPAGWPRAASPLPGRRELPEGEAAQIDEAIAAWETLAAQVPRHRARRARPV